MTLNALPDSERPCPRDDQATPRQNIYPLRYGGGILLFFIGTSLVIAATIGDYWIFPSFVAGALLGVIGVMLLSKLVRETFGRPKKSQVALMMAVIALEMMVFYLLGRSGLLDSGSTPYLWRIILAIVGVHFIAMYWSFGPWLVGLGFANVVWVGLAGILHMQLQPMLLGDGALKLAFGAIMAAPLLLVFFHTNSESSKTA